MQITEKLRIELSSQADEKTRLSGQRYFKEETKLYGIKSAVVTAIGKEYYQQIKNLDKKEIFVYCEDLWQSGYIEEAGIACNWSYYLRKRFEPGDFKTFENWISQYVTNWATCDTFCNHTMGSFLEKYPAFLPELKRWAVSPNRWMRRASAVSLIIPARQGKFLKEIFELAEILLEDRDDMVQKGYGWMLKSASQAYRQQVFDFVMKYKNRMPRTALRYAIEKMPDEMRRKAMAK